MSSNPKKHRAMGDDEWMSCLRRFTASGVWASEAGNRPAPRQKKWHNLYLKVNLDNGMCVHHKTQSYVILKGDTFLWFTVKQYYRLRNVLCSRGDKCLCLEGHGPVTVVSIQTRHQRSLIRLGGIDVAFCIIKISLSCLWTSSLPALSLCPLLGLHNLGGCLKSQEIDCFIMCCKQCSALVLSASQWNISAIQHCHKCSGKKDALSSRRMFIHTVSPLSLPPFPGPSTASISSIPPATARAVRN